MSDYCDVDPAFGTVKDFDSVGAPTTWVLSNHDVVRHTTRLGLPGNTSRPGDGLGPEDEQPDHVLGTRRTKAASLLMLGLPGGVYLYCAAFAARRAHGLGSGSLARAEDHTGPGRLGLVNNDVLVLLNTGPVPVELPDLRRSRPEPGASHILVPEECAWLQVEGEVARP